MGSDLAEGGEVPTCHASLQHLFLRSVAVISHRTSSLDVGTKNPLHNTRVAGNSEHEKYMAS